MAHWFIRIWCMVGSILLVACTTVPPSPFGVMGAVNRGQGQEQDSFVAFGLSGGDQMSALTYAVPRACYGRPLTLTAEYRTTELSGARTSFHGVHFDYDVRRGGVSEYPADFLAEPSLSWQRAIRHFVIPPDATFAILRVGLQGVSGRMEVRNLRISGCEK